MGVEHDKQVFGQTQTGSIYPIPIDNDDYVRIISEEHTRIHQGQAYICSDITSLANNQVFNLVMTIPTSNFVHFRHWEITNTGAPLTAVLYENPTIESIDANSVTNAPCNNARRFSGNTTANSVFIGNTSAISISNLGTQLEHNLATGDKKAGGERGSLSVEWDFKTNEEYVIQIHNQSGGAIQMSYYLFWYEPNDAPLGS